MFKVDLPLSKGGDCTRGGRNAWSEEGPFPLGRSGLTLLESSPFALRTWPVALLGTLESRGSISGWIPHAPGTWN
jgi:hypothetical protein